MRTEAGPWRRRIAAAWLALASWLALGLAAPAFAQGIESVLAPGELIEGHAKWEHECKQCHVRFDRKAQDGLCMACHKDVAADVRARTGYHGRVDAQPCRACHAEHKGRRARIAPLDASQFDHSRTDYALLGKHRQVECTKCHEPGRKFREAPKDCNACHRRDDVHKGTLGPQCADCHTENRWKEAKFDHAKTRFGLTGRDADTKCADCHKDTRYKETPRSCLACHRKDDDSARGHKGQFGERCESCHGTAGWKPSTFNHDSDTRYALRGQHRTAKCAACHSGNLWRDKLSTTCFSCHQKDDKHKEALGRDCGACHTERDWKERSKFDHDRTRFVLLGKHREVQCAACHKSSSFKEAPSDCLSCHKKDDKHEATLGTACQDCHTERAWKPAARFDHDKTRFALRNAHAERAVTCASCHAGPKQLRATPQECVACHKKDDKHQGQQGTRCESCHDDRGWKPARFDHAQSRFALVGRHLAVECKSCHASLRFKEAPRDCHACHKKDDRHALKFGTACESCHNARDWRLWDYDHARRARFALDGAHARLACTRCHSGPAPAGKPIAPLGSTCLSCHRRDDVHDGAFGPACEQCHGTASWKGLRQRLSPTQGAR